MTWSLSSSGTATTSVGTEQTLTTDTTNATYYFESDLTAMVIGDQIQLRVYVMTISGGTMHVAWESTYGPSLPTTPIAPSPSQPSDQSIKVTLHQLSGSSRSIPWKLLRI
jgi:hypothetical protein